MDEKKKRGRPPKVDTIKEDLVVQEQVDKIVKKKKKEVTRTGHRLPGAPQSLDIYCTATDKEVGAMMGTVLKWYGRKPPETDEECEERVKEYFEEIARSGDKPSIETLAMAMGVTRQSLWNWTKGNTRRDSGRADIMDRALLALQALDTVMVQNRKIPESTYIFRAKNFWGMKDQTDVVITPNNPIGPDVPEEELRARIQGDVIIDEDDLVESEP